MNMIFGVVGLSCAFIWLLVLVATQFNVIAISFGLLGALFVLGRAGERRV
ncbi:MAG: hypothetical protein ACR2JC_11035 [Chloroflexota bacterium]